MSGDKLKELAKSALESKSQDQEKADEEKEETKIQDAINEVESITTD